MEIIPEPDWLPIIRQLRERRGITLVLGSTDSGKSSFARYLISALLSENIPLSLVDADIGQSSLGLPGTVCMKTFLSREDVSNYCPDAMVFVGSLNPARKISSMVEGTKSLVEHVRYGGTGTVIVDTTGLITGETGQALKTGKMRAINPEYIVAIQRRGELEHILSLAKDCCIYRIGASKNARARTRESRIQYRTKKFLEYFQYPTRLEIPLKGREVFYDGRQYDLRGKFIQEGCVVGINHNKDTLALGYVDSFKQNSMTVITPLNSSERINRVVVGDIVLDDI
jgi:polynucleotide 5'-hydroxyl-kinase GRC3/NOL9